MPREKHRRKKINPYSIQNFKNRRLLIYLPNEILHIIFLLLIPSDITKSSKFTLDDRRFKYNRDHELPKRYKWNVRYCPKNIWIDLKDGDIDLHSKFSHSHKLHSHDNQLYCDHFKKTLIFIESNELETYDKSRCQNCEMFTYCVVYSYDFPTHCKSECKDALREKIRPIVVGNHYLSYCIKICKD
ncbi:16083_t:CDS:2, partial [Cetraspora pellucida]